MSVCVAGVNIFQCHKQVKGMLYRLTVRFIFMDVVEYFRCDELKVWNIFIYAADCTIEAHSAAYLAKVHTWSLF